jgi:hypothetical protein
MTAKRKMRTTTRPLSEVIARDAKNKKALEAQFLTFYKQIKKTMHGKSELKDLDIPLEKIKESIKAVAHGAFFGTTLVTVEEPDDWEE